MLNEGNFAIEHTSFTAHAATFAASLHSNRPRMVRDDLQRFGCHEICWWAPFTEEADRLFNGIIDATRTRVFSAWCAECGGEVVGHGALLREGEDLELEFISYPKVRMGHGYATEIARALSKYALNTLGLDRLIATVDSEHPQSLHVLKKIGMSVLEQVEVPDGMHFLCRVNRTGPK